MSARFKLIEFRLRTAEESCCAPEIRIFARIVAAGAVSVDTIDATFVKAALVDTVADAVSCIERGKSAAHKEGGEG